ncbi:NAD(P)-binding domain-containing protein [Rhizobium sp. Leaf391]|uniref:NADPH-dependent F420 reductase n=1 Tax=Rhizobium sp. Leaf391 TaxID=1736360 RepID=UPI000AC75A6C
MKVGILGAGHIGKTLVRELSRTGYDVKVANSRGPETIDASIFASGGRAVTIEQAVEDVDILILSIPLNRLPEIAPKIAGLPEDTVVIDTSNYYPMRDTEIGDVEAGEVESVWVSRQLGRTVVKAWNAIGSDSFARLGKPAGHPDRIAIPVAADNDRDRRVAMALVGDRSPGASSRARQFTVLILRLARCPMHWPLRKDPGCRSGEICPSLRSTRGLATRRAIPTRAFLCV